MPPAPRVLVLQHERGTGAGWFGEWLAADGLSLETCHAYAGDEVPHLRSYDAVVVLGGAMGPDEDDRCPWLPVARARLREAVSDSVPVFGICLGAQLLALASGGVVRHGLRGPELGVLDIDVHAAAATDAVFSLLPPRAQVVQWHWEEIAALPEDAVLLASSTSYAHQVFRIGGCAWGVQGHPEVTSQIAASWAREDSPLLLAAGRSPDELVADVRDHERLLAATWRPVAQAFAAVVQARSAAAAAH